MALNFPDSPSLNQVYTDTTSGFSYQWDGVVWKSFAPASSSQIRIIDDISGSFNGSTQTFALTSTGTATIPGNAQQLRVVLGGIVQEPLTDYTVSGSNITFTTPPTGGLDCSIVSLGPAVPVNTIEDGTVTPPKLSTGGPTWNTSGDVYISGIASVGTAITMYASSGIVSATAFYGDGANLSNTGSTLSAASGTERLVFTNLTTGTMTASSTDANVTYNATTQTLSAPNVSIAGTLTYEDVTNVDSIGIITARSGIVISGGDATLGTGVTISGATSDTFTILTNGSERVRVSAGGSVGIGSDDPRAALDIGTGAFISNKPADFWSATDYYSISNYGSFTTQGSFELTLTSNGYRTTSGVWKGLNVNGNTGAAQLRLNPTGSILFGTESNKADGSTQVVTERVRISNTGGFSVGTTANPGAGAIYATGDITAFYSSDIRLKKDIEPISEPIKKLMEISGVTYKWNEEYLKDKEVDGYFVRETEVGVIAQEVEKVLPEVVATRENGYKAVRYEKLVALLIEAVKDQQKQIDELRAQVGGK